MTQSSEEWKIISVQLFIWAVWENKQDLFFPLSFLTHPWEALFLINSITRHLGLVPSLPVTNGQLRYIRYSFQISSSFKENTVKPEDEQDVHRECSTKKTMFIKEKCIQKKKKMTELPLHFIGWPKVCSDEGCMGFRVIFWSANIKFPYRVVHHKRVQCGRALALWCHLKALRWRGLEQVVKSQPDLPDSSLVSLWNVPAARETDGDGQDLSLRGSSGESGVCVCEDWDAARGKWSKTCLGCWKRQKSRSSLFKHVLSVREDSASQYPAARRDRPS